MQLSRVSVSREKNEEEKMMKKKGRLSRLELKKTNLSPPIRSPADNEQLTKRGIEEQGCRRIRSRWELPHQ